MFIALQAVITKTEGAAVAAMIKMASFAPWESVMKRRDTSTWTWNVMARPCSSLTY
jgi:hypothetical protein